MKNTPPYSAASIANFFIEKAMSESKSESNTEDSATSALTHMKLQKLIYFAHGWHLGLKHKPLINESFEAWDFGPVLSKLYQQLKPFRDNPINAKALDIDGQVAVPPADNETKEFLEIIWEKYSQLSAHRLSRMTHEPGSPWDKAIITIDGKRYILRNMLIPDNDLEEYFTQLAKKSEA